MPKSSFEPTAATLLAFDRDDDGESLTDALTLQKVAADIVCSAAAEEPHLAPNSCADRNAPIEQTSACTYCGDTAHFYTACPLLGGGAQNTVLFMVEPLQQILPVSFPCGWSAIKMWDVYATLMGPLGAHPHSIFFYIWPTREPIVCGDLNALPASLGIQPGALIGVDFVRAPEAVAEVNPLHGQVHRARGAELHVPTQQLTSNTTTSPACAGGTDTSTASGDSHFDYSTLESVTAASLLERLTTTHAEVTLPATTPKSFAPGRDVCQGRDRDVQVASHRESVAREQRSGRDADVADAMNTSPEDWLKARTPPASVKRSFPLTVSDDYAAVYAAFNARAPTTLRQEAIVTERTVLLQFIPGDITVESALDYMRGFGEVARLRVIERHPTAADRHCSDGLRETTWNLFCEYMEPASARAYLQFHATGGLRVSQGLFLRGGPAAKPISRPSANFDAPLAPNIHGKRGTKQPAHFVDGAIAFFIPDRRGGGVGPVLKQQQTLLRSRLILYAAFHLGVLRRMPFVLDVHCQLQLLAAEEVSPEGALAMVEALQVIPRSLNTMGHRTPVVENTASTPSSVGPDGSMNVSDDRVPQRQRQPSERKRGGRTMPISPAAEARLAAAFSSQHASLSVSLCDARRASSDYTATGVQTSYFRALNSYRRAVALIDELLSMQHNTITTHCAWPPHAIDTASTTDKAWTSLDEAARSLVLQWHDALNTTVLSESVVLRGLEARLQVIALLLQHSAGSLDVSEAVDALEEMCDFARSALRVLFLTACSCTTRIAKLKVENPFPEALRAVVRRICDQILIAAACVEPFSVEATCKAIAALGALTSRAEQPSALEYSQVASGNTVLDVRRALEDPNAQVSRIAEAALSSGSPAPGINTSRGSDTRFGFNTSNDSVGSTLHKRRFHRGGSAPPSPSPTVAVGSGSMGADARGLAATIAPGVGSLAALVLLYPACLSPMSAF